MTIKQSSTFRECVHIVLFVLSTLLNVNMFLLFGVGASIIIQVSFALLAVGYECLKVYLLMIGKYNLQKKKYIGIVQLVCCVGLAFVSVISALGFSMTTIDSARGAFVETQERQIVDVSNLDFQIDERKRTLAFLEDELVGFQNKYDSYPNTWITQRNIEYERIEKNKAEREHVNSELSILLVERKKTLEQGEVLQESVQNPFMMFVLLGESIGLEGLPVMTFILFSLMVFLEFGIALTSGNIQDKSPIVKTRVKPIRKKALGKGLPSTTKPHSNNNILSVEDIEAYVNIAFGRGKEVKSAEVVAEESPFSIEKAKSIEKALMFHTMEGKPLVYADNGKLLRNFNSEKILSAFARKYKE